MGRERFTLVAAEVQDQGEAFSRDVRVGLTGSPKSLSCRYLYDAEGSRLFDAICELPEYYVTRAEREILQSCAAEVVSRLPLNLCLAELGSGSADKTRLLIEALLARQAALRYVPLDISRSALEESSRRLLLDYPALEIVAIAAEYNDGLGRLFTAARPVKLILWLGSNVGNYPRKEAASLLRCLQEAMSADDRLLVGIDLRKDPEVLERAYDDSKGVTARFNLNLLARINRELGGRFDLETFRHQAVYEAEAGRVRMYLVSRRAQRVQIDGLGLEVEFQAGEGIHTEDSVKYSLAEIEALAGAAGLRLKGQWLDRQGRFAVNLLAPAPQQ
jgi:L-histidine N-alpha-methyltransferase